jgi:hypothetical protein
MPLQYISLLRAVLVLKFIDNCLQCLGRMTTPVTIKWVWIICAFFKSLFMIYLTHIVVNDVDIGTLWPTHYNNWSFGRSSMGSAQHPPIWQTIVSQQFLFGLPKDLIWRPGPLTHHSFLLRALKMLYTLYFTTHTGMNRFGRWFYTEIENRYIETFAICLWSTNWNEVLECNVYSLYFQGARIVQSD